jgi:hypothetical protein
MAAKYDSIGLGYADRRIPDRREEHWHIETTSSSQLERHGWTSDSIKPGDELVVAGYPAKDGHPYMKMEWIRRSDGQAMPLWLPARSPRRAAPSSKS